MFDDLLQAQWIEGRQQIARWLIDRGFPNPELGKRYRFETEDGGKGEGDIESYAAMTRGAGSREHFAARAIELIDRVLSEAERTPWRAIGWAHELGTLDGDARLAGVEPVWRRGLEAIEAGEHAATATHGTPEERRAKREKRRASFEKYRKQDLSKGEAERKAARECGCTTRTIRAAVKGK